MNVRAFFPFVLLAASASACAAPSPDDDASSAEQEVGKTKRVAFPASPFDRDACTGVPIDEAGLAKKLGKRTSKKVGSFVYAIHHRAADWSWDGRRWDPTYRWEDAPNDTLTAWYEDGTHAAFGPSVYFSKQGNVEVFRDATGVHLRLVGERAEMPSPDTTDAMRLVFAPMDPWRFPGRAYGLDPFLEQSTDDAKTWLRVTRDWNVHLSAFDVARYHRYVSFDGNDAVAIVTERCGHYVSSRRIGGVSPISASIGIFFAFD